MTTNKWARKVLDFQAWLALLILRVTSTQVARMRRTGIKRVLRVCQKTIANARIEMSSCLKMELDIRASGKEQ